MTPAQWLLLIGALLALGAGLLLRRMSRRLWALGGLPQGEVVSVDMGVWEQGETLRAEEYGLVGRPDYLVRAGRQLLPVEVKPNRSAAQPYESDLLQLGAYCLLVEVSAGRAPAAGFLRYRGTTFRIPYGTALRQRVLATLAAMRTDAECNNVARDHDDPARCRFCGVRAHCRERL